MSPLNSNTLTRPERPQPKAKTIPSLAINNPLVRWACVTANPEFGYGVQAWLASEQNAQYNASITGGVAVPVTMDGSGRANTPKAAIEALKLVGIQQ